MTPRSPSATDSTSAGPGSDVRISSAPWAAPRGLSAALAPRSRYAFASSDRTSWTTRAWPALMRFRAIGPPMLPSPMNPMRIVTSDARAAVALEHAAHAPADARLHHLERVAHHVTHDPPVESLAGLLDVRHLPGAAFVEADRHAEALELGPERVVVRVMPVAAVDRVRAQE